MRWTAKAAKQLQQDSYQLGLETGKRLGREAVVKEVPTQTTLAQIEATKAIARAMRTLAWSLAKVNGKQGW